MPVTVRIAFKQGAATPAIDSLSAVSLVSLIYIQARISVVCGARTSPARGLGRVGVRERLSHTLHSDQDGI